MFNGRRQPSRGGTSRMTRECQVRICEGLGVKFPGPTRHSRRFGNIGVGLLTLQKRRNSRHSGSSPSGPRLCENPASSRTRRMIFLRLIKIDRA